MFLYVDPLKVTSANSKSNIELSPTDQFPILDTDDFVVEVLSYAQLQEALGCGITIKNLKLSQSDGRIICNPQLRFDTYMDDNPETPGIISSEDNAIIIHKSPSKGSFAGEMTSLKLNTFEVAGKTYTIEFMKHGHELIFGHWGSVDLEDDVTDIWLAYAFRTGRFFVARFFIKRASKPTIIMGFVWLNTGRALGSSDMEHKIVLPAAPDILDYRAWVSRKELY